jgi:6-phosphofructokinase
MDRKNAFYAQSGGVSAVINASACGVLETARQHSEQIGEVYAGRNGIIGALTEDLIDTSLEPRRRLPRSNTPRVRRSARVATSLGRSASTARSTRA